MLKQIAEALLETVQCPVCLSALRPPVTLCSSGHGLCPDCKPTIEVCPTCRENFIDIKPIILHQLLEALPRDCQYKSLGCAEVYIPGGSHEQVCCYRTVDCKVLECEWTGQARRLKDHVMTAHDETVIVEEVKSELTWDYLNRDEDSFKYIPFVADDQVLWAYVNLSVQVSKLCISFTQSPIGAPRNQHFAIVRFKNGVFEFTHTIKIPLDTSDAIFDFLEDHCMMIPVSMLSRFVNQDSSLEYSIQFVKEKI